MYNYLQYIHQIFYFWVLKASYSYYNIDQVTKSDIEIVSDFIFKNSSAVVSIAGATDEIPNFFLDFITFNLVRRSNLTFFLI